MGCLGVVLAVDLQDTPVQVEVLLVENVFFVIVCFSFVLTVVVAARCLVEFVTLVPFQLSIKLLDFLLV